MADEITSEQYEKIFDLAEKFANMRNHKVLDVILALFNSNSLKRTGYDGSGQLTRKQADVCIGILESWIQRVCG